MAKQHPIEIFMPPNVLKAKVGGSGGVDLAAVRRAEHAMTGMKTNFESWVAADAGKLAAARDAYAVDGNAETQTALYRVALDLKGQGASFDYPLISRIASSLCRLSDGVAGALPLDLVDAHVEAIRIVIRDSIKSTDNPVANRLAAELEARVETVTSES